MTNRVNQLLDRARRETGLENFGGDSFREGLDILVASADGEAHLNDIGKQAFDAIVVASLSWRLKIENWYDRHPEIDDEQIIAPLIGLGLPRSGSTAFSCLLAEDPAARSIRNWEAQEPTPPPESTTQFSDPRIDRARQMLARRYELFPRMRQMLPSAPDSPMECSSFQNYDFKSQLFQVTAQIPSYVEWLHHKADLVPTYEYVKRCLKLLQWRCGPKRWRLKNPGHSLFINDVIKVFPDAKFWMTHRDIASVIPSVTDLYWELLNKLTTAPDKDYIRDLNLEWCEIGMRRMIAFRDAGNDHLFFDAHFAEFQRDPYPTLQRLYDFLGEELTEDAKARMEAWRKAMPRDKHGGHSYDPADYGIDIGAVRQRFKFYTDRFNVPLSA